jgi:hypothetical protein
MEDYSRLMMSAYLKFSALLQNQVHAPTAPNPPKASKLGPVGQTGSETLGELGALGGTNTGTENPAAPASGAAVVWGEAEDERAAIVECDGNIPRAWAEGFTRLHPDRPPGDVALRRWQQFVDDVGRFLDSSFCAVASALGWGPLDLFGCDRDRPFARVDRAGLLWLLNGDRLVEFDRHRAAIERRTGARQTYRRKPVSVGDVVLAWELKDDKRR